MANSKKAAALLSKKQFISESIALFWFFFNHNESCCAWLGTKDERTGRRDSKQSERAIEKSRSNRQGRNIEHLFKQHKYYLQWIGGSRMLSLWIWIYQRPENMIGKIFVSFNLVNVNIDTDYYCVATVWRYFDFVFSKFIFL